MIEKLDYEDTRMEVQSGHKIEYDKYPHFDSIVKSLFRIVFRKLNEIIDHLNTQEEKAGKSRCVYGHECGGCEFCEDEEGFASPEECLQKCKEQLEKDSGLDQHSIASNGTETAFSSELLSRQLETNKDVDPYEECAKEIANKRLTIVDYTQGEAIEEVLETIKKHFLPPTK